MKLKKIAQCLSVATLLCSVQVFAASAPLDSAPTAVNFSGNVTAGTCSIVGTSANQIITLPDMTINQAMNMPTGSGKPGNMVNAVIQVTNCSNMTGSSMKFQQFTYTGTPGTSNAGKSFVPTSGSAKGLDFGIYQRSALILSGGSTATPWNSVYVAPGVPATALVGNGSSSGSVSNTAIFDIPLEIGVYRNSDPIVSGDMSMVANITITNP